MFIFLETVQQLEDELKGLCVPLLQADHASIWQLTCQTVNPAGIVNGRPYLIQQGK